MYTSHYPKDVPFEVPEGWVWTTLGTISSYGACQCVPVEQISEDAWVLELEDIEKGTGKLISQKTKKERAVNGIRYSFEKGQVLYSKLRTYLNKVLLANKNGFCSTEIMPITFYGGIISEYMVIVLSSPYFLDYTASCGYGVKMPRLGTNYAIKAAIPIPPISEQRIIVQQVRQWLCLIDELSYLEEELSIDINNARLKILDYAIHGKLVPQDPNEESAVELLRRINPDYTPSHNLHYEGDLPNGWELCHLDDVCDILDSQRKPINAEERAIRNTAVGTKYPYYGATGQVDTINDYLFDGDFILLGEDGAPFLEPHSPKAYSVSGKIWVNNHAHILSPKCNLKYLLYYLNSINYHPFVTGTTRLKLTQEAMKRITILLPPKLEQLRIISQLDSMFSVLNGITESIDAS